MNTAAASNTVFLRDRFTWLAYFMLGYYAFMQAALGPLMPFLSAELDLNFTVSGFHLSAFALGMVFSGLFGDRIAARWGRPAAFWGGGGGMALGALLLLAGRTPAVTVAGSLVMGTLGSLLLVMIQATLSDRHQERRATALTESNITASIFASAAPLLIGLGQGLGPGWRVALLFGGGFWLLLFLLRRTEPVPAEAAPPPRKASGRPAPLPRLFWAYWLVLFLGVSIEWCMVFWGASFLELAVGLPRVDAATAMSAFFIAMIFGRVAGSRLTRRFSSAYLLRMAVLLVLAAFPLFWLAPWPPLNLLGLFLMGLGVANLFPLTLAAASNLAPTQASAVSARVALAAGSAILITPQALGSVADSVGIAGAYTIVAVFATLATAMLFFTWFLSRSKLQGAKP